MRNSSIHPRGVWVIKAQKIQFIIKALLDFILKFGTAWDGLEQLLLFFSRWKAQSRGLALTPELAEWEYFPSQGKFLWILPLALLPQDIPVVPIKRVTPRRWMRAEVAPKTAADGMMRGRSLGALGVWNNQSKPACAGN